MQRKTQPRFLKTGTYEWLSHKSQYKAETAMIKFPVVRSEQKELESQTCVWQHTEKIPVPQS